MACLLLIHHNKHILLYNFRNYINNKYFYIIYKKDLKLKISWLFLAILLIVLISQTILLINSVGDCGDGDGSYRFYERLIGTNGSEYCNTGKKAAPPLNFGILNSIGLYSNFLALTILIIQVYYRAVIIIIKSIPNTINNILNYIFKI